MQLHDGEIYKALRTRELILRGFREGLPFQDVQIQPASVDLRLDDRFLRFRPGVDLLDIRENDGGAYLRQRMEEFFLEPGEPLDLPPGEVIFGQVYEQMYIGEGLSGRIEGRSRVARMGLSVHCTGAYINPGYYGAMPLQLVNHAPCPVRIYPYVSICQLILVRLTGEPQRHYGRDSGNAYQGEEEKARTSVLSTREEAPGTLAMGHIQALWERYCRDHTRDSRPVAQGHIEIQAKNVIVGGDHMGDKKYIFENSPVTGSIIGDHAGENAAVNVSLTQSAPTAGELTAILRELGDIKAYLREKGTDEADVLLGETTQLREALEDEDAGELKAVLRRCGGALLSVAKEVGCSLFTAYLQGQLGIGGS